MKRLALILTLLLSFALPSVVCRADTQDEQDAAAAAQGLFDAWYRNKTELWAGPQPPLKDLFLQSTLLTPSYKEAYRKQVEAEGGISWDPTAIGNIYPGCPRLCVIAATTEHDAGVVVLSGVRGTTTHLLAVRMLRVGGRWLIDGLARTVHTPDA